MPVLLRVDKKHWIFFAIMIVGLVMILALYAYWVDVRSKTLISQVRSQLIPEIYREYDTNALRPKGDPFQENHPKFYGGENISEGSCLSCAQHRKIIKQEDQEIDQSSINATN